MHRRIAELAIEQLSDKVEVFGKRWAKNDLMRLGVGKLMKPVEVLSPGEEYSAINWC